MKAFGLKPEEAKEMKNLFQKFFGDLEDAKIYLFGSRASGNQKEFSDIDLAVNSKSKDLSKRISLFKEGWEKSRLPYKVDITSWKEIYKPYLPQIKKEKVIIWKPDEKELHPWRVCPYGQHWVRRHPRHANEKIQDVDGHCRRNHSGKDILPSDEIEFISNSLNFKENKSLPCPYNGKEKIINANDYDVLISSWCKYWNDIFRPDIPIDPNFIKALIYSESRFNANAITKNKMPAGPARGLIQLTEQSLDILKDKKGEIKDHYIMLKKEDLFDPNKNISASIRWLFHKREILEKRLKRSPTWIEVVAEYKGLGNQLKNDGVKATKIMSDFLEAMENFKC